MTGECDHRVPAPCKASASGPGQTALEEDPAFKGGQITRIRQIYDTAAVRAAGLAG